MPHMPGHSNQDLPHQPLPAMKRGAMNVYNFLQGKVSSLPQLATMNSRGDRIDPRRVPKPPAMGGPTPSVRMPQSGQRGAVPNQSLPALPVSRDPRSIMNPYGRSVAKGQQPRKTPLIPPGLIPKNPDQLFPYENSESTKPITMDSLREPERRGEPIPQALTPSQIIQTSPAVTGKFMGDSVDSAGNPVRRSAANKARRAVTPEINKNKRQLRASQRLLEQMKAKNPLPDPSQEPRPRDYFGEQRKNMEDLGMTELQPVSPGMATPQSPQVDESLLSRLPSRSERDRSSMQPGGMVSGDTFDAMAAREREERLAPQRALAQREDVTAEDGRNFTRTVDRDPNSPTFGQAKVVGDPMFGPSVPQSVQQFIKDGGNLNSAEGRPFRSMLNASREPRRRARLAGEVYTDPETGVVTDYGKYDDYRQRLAEGPTLENMSDARKLRMRRAQLRNYGRTGGVTVAPGGGIAGPMTVGTQATFGPNMSLNQATLMAQRQLDEESRLDDAMKRQDELLSQERDQKNVDAYVELAKENPMLARQFAEGQGMNASFTQKSDAEIAMNMKQAEETRKLLQTDPQAILDMEDRVLQTYPNDPAKQAELRASLGLTPALVDSAMRRTESGMTDAAWDTGKRVTGIGIGQAGQALDSFLGTNIFGPIGQGIGNYIANPTDDQIDEDEQRRRLNQSQARRQLQNADR